MPTIQPIGASGSRVGKKPANVPKKVKAAIEILVRGRPDDESNSPVDFVEAAKLAGVNAWVVRQWLDRAEGRKFLAAERAAFRSAVSAGNELSLKRIRDHAPNSMAQLGAGRILEQIDADEARTAADSKHIRVL